MSRKPAAAKAAPNDAERTSKLYYSIGEVSELTSVKQHVLRYWETEFPTLRPRKTRTGSRRYRPQDIEEILAIKRLLYEQGFRIDGARKVRHQAHRQSEDAAATAALSAQLEIGFERLDPQAQLRYVRDELRTVAELLKQMGEGPAASLAPASASVAPAPARAEPRAAAKSPAARPRARAAKEG